MVKICKVCESQFEEPADEFEKKTPHVCGPECLAEYLKEVGRERGGKLLFPEGEKRGIQAKSHARRSKEEIYFECFLERYNIFAVYEPEIIKLKDGSWYLPDYYLPEYDVYMEVKGLWHKGAKKKVRLFPTEKKIFLVRKDLMHRLKISSTEKQEALKKKYVSPL